jgi:hypothetical protein
LRTALSTIADITLAADHDHAPSVDHPSDALDQRSSQWVISGEQPRVISGKRRSWGDYLGDHLGATALVHRLLHHSHVIVINGPSYRDWEHKQDIGDTPVATTSMTAPATAAAKSAARASSGGARRRGK